MKKAKEYILAGRSEKANKLMGLPKVFWGKSLDTYKGNDEAKGKALTSISTGWGVLLMGKCGRGKTHLATGLACHWFAERMEIISDKLVPTGKALFVSTVDLFYELKETFNSKDKSEKAVIEKYCNVPLLILDDMGAEVTSEWSVGVFYLLLDRRYREMRQTIVTTNLSLQEISDNFNDRIASRLCEMGATIELRGDDRRVKG